MHSLDKCVLEHSCDSMQIFQFYFILFFLISLDGFWENGDFNRLQSVKIGEVIHLRKTKKQKTHTLKDILTEHISKIEKNTQIVSLLMRYPNRSERGGGSER